MVFGPAPASGKQEMRFGFRKKDSEKEIK